MLLSIPPRSSSRARLVPGLSLCEGDLLAQRFRVLSLARADRACAYVIAQQTGTGERVEIQILVAMDDEAEEVHLRFLSDARKAAALSHPRIEKVIHVGVTRDGHPFVVREARKGQSLAELLERVGSLPTESAVDVAIAVCEALESAHAHGIVHGVLEESCVHLAWALEGPTNVVLSGLATSRALAMLPPGRTFSAVTIRAPEHLDPEREVDVRSDVWGVGVLLYTMLAGAPPFAADSPSNVNLSVALDEPPMLAGVPEGLAEIVDACLAREPALRPPTAASLADRLGLFCSKPIVVRRPTLLVVDTGPYPALTLEPLLQRAQPESSEPSIEVEFTNSVPDLSALSAESPPMGQALLAKTPIVPIAPMPIEEAPISAERAPSSAPVAISLAPPPSSRRGHGPRSASRGRKTAIALAASVVFGAFVGGAFMRATAPDRVGASPAAGAALVAPSAALPLPGALGANDPATASSPSAPAMAGMPALAVTDLPSPATPPKGRRPAASAEKPSRATAAPRASTASGKAAAEAAPSVDPIVQSAQAPVQPNPKANDDDLRRFLDDRR